MTFIPYKEFNRKEAEKRLAEEVRKSVKQLSDDTLAELLTVLSKDTASAFNYELRILIEEDETKL